MITNGRTNGNAATSIGFSSSEPVHPAAFGAARPSEVVVGMQEVKGSVSFLPACSDTPLLSSLRCSIYQGHWGDSKRRVPPKEDPLSIHA